MAKWLNIAPDKLIYQPAQQKFLTDRRRRLCRLCSQKQGIQIEYIVDVSKVPDDICPTCGDRGERVFDRMTIMAGRRFGKSKFGSIAGSEEATLPNTIGWACAPTNPKLFRYVIPAFQQLIPAEWVLDWDGDLLDLRLKNGSLIHFQTLEDPDQGRGQGLDWLWIDEVCELTKRHWEVIAPSLGDRLGAAFFTTSPRGYDWVFDELYKPAEDDVPGYWALSAKTRDNPKFQTDKGRAFLARERRRMSDVMYRQEYEADFVTYTGSIYGEHLHQTHILRTMDEIKALIPSWPDLAHLPTIVGIDTGADHPFGALKVVSTERGLVVVGEYLDREKSYIEHSAAMKALASASHVTWAINKNEKQGMIELAQHGIFCAPAQNDQVAGIERVKSWLVANKLWFVEHKVPRAIQQLRAYRWAENTAPKTGEARKEKVHKRNDELPDCLRYALMTWPMLPKHEDPTTPIRDISNLPDGMQQTIQRMRKIADKKDDTGEGVVGDFWG